MFLCWLYNIESVSNKLYVSVWHFGILYKMGRQLQNKKQILLHKNLSVQVSVLNLSWHDNLTAYYSSEPVLQWQLQQTRAPDLQPILAGCGTVAGGMLSLAGLSLLFWVGIWTGSAMMTWLSVMDISMGPWSSWVLPDLKFEFLLQSSSTVYDMFEINEGITSSFPWRTVCPRERILGRNWILSH